MRLCAEKKMTAEEVIDTCKRVPKREELFAKREDKAKNPYWKPISHSHAVETIMGAFEKHDIKVLDSSFGLNKSGHTLVGGMEVVGDCLPQKNVDGNFQLFVRHANDMSVGVQLNAGLNLFVCTNGMMTGDRLASHRHTINFDFDAWIVDETIPAFVDKCNDVNLCVDKMRNYELSDAQAYRLILESADRRIVPYARAIDVYREWEHPTFASNDFQSNTMWKLYNDFTYVAQKCQPERHHDILSQTHEFLISEC